MALLMEMFRKEHTVLAVNWLQFEAESGTCASPADPMSKWISSQTDRVLKAESCLGGYSKVFDGFIFDWLIVSQSDWALVVLKLF